MRSRPEIEIKVPVTVHPGDRVRVGVTLTSGSETPIDFVRIALRCVAVIRHQASSHHELVRRRFELSEQVEGAGELAEGTHRYEATFSLPADAPPTYLGNLGDCRTWVNVHVSIPWWLDAHEAQELTVAPVQRARPADAPSTSSSLSRNEPFVEVSLPRAHFAPGEAIEGAIAFGNLRGGRLSALDVSLVGLERVAGPFGAVVTESARITRFKEIGRTGEGSEVPFRLPIPADTVPGFDAGQLSLEHVFEATLEREGGGSLRHRVPVVLGPYARALGGGAEPGERERVGSSRWSAAWAAAGEAHGLRLERRKLGLKGALSGCDAAVRPGKSSGGEPGLRSGLRFPVPWGLELALGGRGLLRRGIRTGDEDFDRRFRLGGRDEEQVRAALGAPLRAALLRFEEAELDDEGARVWSDRAPSDERGLARHLQDLAALAEAAQAAGRAIPPPAGMEASLPAWRRFAGDVAGELVVGSMRLSGGSFEGMPLDIETTFDGPAPVGTAIAIAIDPPLERDPGLCDEAARAAAPEAVRELCEAVVRRGAALIPAAPEAAAAAPPEELAPLLRVEAGRVALELGAPLADPGAAREALASMQMLVRALRGDRRGGPYR
ncbi:MAG: sporulation protein [Polyangiaceae bacterium]|nr:sporulation protein [Polyangiaceae bacterium]